MGTNRENIISNAIGWLVVTVGAIFVTLIRDDGYDFFWYLGAGQIMHGTAHVGSAYTSEGHPWNNHEWLFHWILGLSPNPSIFHLIIKFILVFGIILAVYLVSLRRTNGKHFIAAFMAVASGVLLGEFTSLRAQLGSYLLFVVTWGVLESGMSERKKALLLAPVFLLWANIHGGFVLGIAIVIWHQVYYFVKTIVREHKLSYGYLLPILVALLVPLINQSGIGVYEYPLKWTGNVLYKGYIREWTSIIRWDVHLYPYIAFTILAIPILLAGRPHKKVEIIPLVLFAILPFSAVRHLPFYYLFASPMIACSLGRLDESLARKSQYSVLGGNFKWIVLIVAVLFVRVYSLWMHPILRATDPIFQKYVYPTGATAFMRENSLNGRLLNAYQWGGYLWRDGWDVFIDGRLDTLYPEDVFREYADIVTVQSDWKDLLNKWEVGFVIYDTTLKDSTPKLNAAVIQDTDWIILYQDPVATLFARRNKLDTVFLEKYRRGDISIPDEPMCQYAAGMSLFQRNGGAGEIEKYLRRAIKLDPVFAQPHIGLARLYFREKDYSEAISEIGIAKKLGLNGNEVDDLTEIAGSGSE